MATPEIEKNRKNELPNSPNCSWVSPRSCIIGLLAKPKTALSAKFISMNMKTKNVISHARRATECIYSSPLTAECQHIFSMSPGTRREPHSS